MQVWSCDPPLIHKISKVNVIHKWYADDGNARGRIYDLDETFRALKTECPGYGYFVNTPKMPSNSEERKNGPRPGDVCRIKRANNARNQSTRLSHRHPRNMRQIPRRQKRRAEKLLSKLGDIAKTNPQKAHACLTKGVKHKVNFITRTTLSFLALLETSEAIIRESIIPELTSRKEPLPIERAIFSLPLKSGGLGKDCPENHHDDYELSKKLSEPLEDKGPLTAELWRKRTLDDLLNAKKKIAEKESNNKSVLSTYQRYALERASEKGASAWLNLLPLKR